MPHGEPFGSGPKLDEDWDFVIDSTGDLDHVEGDAELEKDLAFKTAQELQPFLGRPINRTINGRIRLKIQTLLNDDERITEIVSLEITRDTVDEIVIDLEVIADDGVVYDFVFPVNEHG